MIFQVKSKVRSIAICYAFIFISFISLSCPFFIYQAVRLSSCFFMSKVGSLPTTAEPKNRTKAFGELLFFQLRAVMDVMHLGYVTLWNIQTKLAISLFIMLTNVVCLMPSFAR
jgi:hypothetical protein